jgi:eukaryotic-like serine/threonine-protein kinase
MNRRQFVSELFLNSQVITDQKGGTKEILMEPCGTGAILSLSSSVVGIPQEFSLDTQPRNRALIRFGSFEFDSEAFELHRGGVSVRIQKQSLQLLSALLERPGHVVTRQELQKRLWPADTFVDFEDGLNTVVKKLRETLGDDREHPQFIETVPRHGYRFIARVDLLDGAEPNGYRATLNQPAVARVRGTEDLNAPEPVSKGRPRLWAVLGVVLAIALALAVWVTHGWPAFSFAPHDSVFVSDFENGTGDPELDDALRTAFTVSLEQSRHFNVFPRARIGPVLERMGKPGDARINPALGREICQRENIRGLIAVSIARTGQEYALSAELIDPLTGSTVRSYSQRVHGEDHVLEALDRISADARADLGESLYQIHEANRPLPEVTTSSLTALREYADGVSLWHRGQFADAVTHLRAAVDADPDFAMAHAALAGTDFSYIVNDQPSGQREYDRALALSQRTTERERLLIQANYADDLGHVAAADGLYRLYLERYPEDWQVLSDYARLLRKHGKQQEAIERYWEILRVAPDDSTTYVEMATAYKTLGRIPEALGAYGEAFKLDSQWLTTGNTNREYGFALVANGEDEKAAQVFSALLADPKTRETGLRSLALLDLYHGRYASARHRFQEALLLDESPPTALSLARVHLWLGIVAEGQGNTREELRELDAAASQIKNVGPKVVFGTFVGLEYARAKATVQARGIENRIAPLVDPKSSEQTGYLHLLQGEIALAEGSSYQAINLLTLADHDNTNPFTVEALANAYQQIGDTDQAISWYERLTSLPLRALSWEPQQRWVAAHYTLAADYLARNEPDKASHMLSMLLAMWKNSDPDLPLRKQSLILRARIS